MKAIIFLILIGIISVLLNSSSTIAINPKNSSCIFTPKLKLYNYSFEMYGLKDYYPDLVENTRAYYYIKLTTSGDLSEKEAYSIHPHLMIQCDGNRRLTDASPTINFHNLTDDTILTDFILEGSFFIPEDSKNCYAILDDIYAFNNTWEVETQCDYPAICTCYVTGLSHFSHSIEREVLTKEEFFAKKAIITSKEIAKEQSLINIGNIVVGAVISLVSVFVAYKLTEKRFKKEKFLRACEDVHRSMVDCFYKINEAANVQPKTLQEYETKVGIVKEKFENSLNINSLFFDKVLSNALDDVRLAFRQASRAIFMNLPKGELPKGFNIESYPKEYKRIDWDNLNNSFRKARELIRKKFK